VAGSFEHGNEFWVSIAGGKFRSGGEILKNDPAPFGVATVGFLRKGEGRG
jgi:hypothetical protein